ncbi:MAG TPA: choice-of-anchor D domain-containing protein [Bryobacteraceae bacterium]|nr:choice-of-anchor D domain-containing protein [Bryobacteraceae bacterium]
MTRRVLLLAFLGASSIPAQLSLFVLQGDSEAPINGQYGFGTVSMGDVRDIPFRLRNTGNSSTPLTVLSLAGADFSFVNPPAVPQDVAGGAEVDVIVRYAPSAPSSRATFAADGVSAVFFGNALGAGTVSLDDGGDALRLLMADAVIDFGSAVRGSTVTRHIVVANPSTSDKISIRNVVALGAAFHLTRDPLPIVLAPGVSATMRLDFTPMSNGTQLGTLEIDQRSFHLTGTGLDPAAPLPSIALDVSQRTSAQQGKLTVKLASISKATTTGEVDIDIRPNTATANTDGGILFLATGSRNAKFNIKPGDTVGRFGSEDNVVFQTGTTAGDIVFTVKLGDATEQSMLTIPRAIVEVDTAQAQHTSAGLDVRVSGFDNTRTISKIIFTCFDRKGTALNPGAITVDTSAAFQEFFASSDLGGVFALHAFIPVIGRAAQVAAVEVQITNAAGTAQTSRLRVTP